MAYTNDSLNSEELADLYNSEAINLMFPENPVGYFVYKLYGHLKDDDLLFLMSNSNNIFMCAHIHLHYIGERYNITRPKDYIDLEYRILIALETHPILDKNIMERVLRRLFHDNINDSADIRIGDLLEMFRFSDKDKDNSLMSAEGDIRDLMERSTGNFVIHVPDSVDRTSLCRVLKDLNLPYTVAGGCTDRPVPVPIVYLPTTYDYYTYDFAYDYIYDIKDLNDYYRIEIGSTSNTSLKIKNNKIVIVTDTYNRVSIISPTRFRVNGKYSGVVYNDENRELKERLKKLELLADDTMISSVGLEIF